MLSKTVVPEHVTHAFDGFIENCLTSEDLDRSLPIAEKAALRSPEIALPGRPQFAYKMSTLKRL